VRGFIPIAPDAEAFVVDLGEVEVGAGLSAIGGGQKVAQGIAIILWNQFPLQVKKTEVATRHAVILLSGGLVSGQHFGAQRIFFKFVRLRIGAKKGGQSPFIIHAEIIESDGVFGFAGQQPEVKVAAFVGVLSDPDAIHHVEGQSGGCRHAAQIGSLLKIGIRLG